VLGIGCIERDPWFSTGNTLCDHMMGKQSPAATANKPGRYDIDLPIRIETRNLAN
jgi:hypothetical protein